MSGAVLTLPVWDLRIAGAACAPAMLARAVGVTVRHIASRSSCLELELRLEDDAAEVIAALPLGAAIELALDGGDLFRGEITAHEEEYPAAGGDRLWVRAYDQLQALAERQPVRVLGPLSAAAALRDLAGGCGLSVVTPGEGPRFEQLFQVGRSDLDLIAEVCWRAGWACIQRGSELQVFALSGSGPAILLRRGRELRSLRRIRNARALPQRIAVETWSPTDVTKGSDAATASTRPSLATAAEARSVAGLASDDPAQAAAWAQGELDRRHQDAERCRICCEGDVALVPGAVIAIEGYGVTTTHCIGSATHVIDASGGYRCELDTGAPPAPKPQRATTATIATVTAVNDPNGQGRIQVSFDAYADLGSRWLPVVLPGAGAGKGLVALPAKGDRVLVLACGGDLAQAVVLGALWESGGAPESAGVSGGDTKAYHLVTPGGQILHLDDAANTAELTSSQGHRLTLEPGGVTLSSKGSLTLEAPGGSVTITGSSVDFKQG